MRKSLFLLPLISGLVLSLAACSNESGEVAGGPGSITTNGIALVDGQPASYATVALRRVDYRAPEAFEMNALVAADYYADEKGMFDVNIPADGEYRLTVLHDGVAYSKVVNRTDFEEVGKATRPDTLHLKPTAVMAGVLDIPEGSSAVWVGVVGTDVLVKTDVNGWFVLSALPANDSLVLYFVNEDFTQTLGEKTIYVNPMESIMVDYRSEKTVEKPVDPVPEDSTEKDTADVDTVHKIVTLLGDSTPASYATVALRAADAMVGEYVAQNAMVKSDLQADARGRFTMNWPADGRYRLTVVKGGFAFSKEYSAKELAKIDTLRLVETASISSKVTLRSSDEYLWVGVYGLDLLVKTNGDGSYELSNVPANDSLGIYFVTADSDNRLYAEWSNLVEPGSAEFLSPVKLLQDFESDGEGWYLNADSLKKGTVFVTQSVKDGIEFDAERGSNVFHGKYSLANDDYAWVLVGTSFENYMNFAAIDSVVFYAKGDGKIRLTLENYIDDTQNLKAATEWISLSSTWQRISVNPSELCVGSASEEVCFATWYAVKGGVKQFHLFPHDGSDFYIDDVTLYGALF